MCICPSSPNLSEDTHWPLSVCQACSRLWGARAAPMVTGEESEAQRSKRLSCPYTCLSCVSVREGEETSRGRRQSWWFHGKLTSAQRLTDGFGSERPSFWGWTKQNIRCITSKYRPTLLHMGKHEWMGFLVALWFRIHLQFRIHRRCGFNSWVWKIPWRKTWQPTSVFVSGETPGQRSLEGYSP